uniref:PBP1A family penicillin-binding protein n=1 Tax=candidate division WWE3 bacterium TaxID=2053526 RepID=A0A7C4TJ61_UNCKA
MTEKKSEKEKPEVISKPQKTPDWMRITGRFFKVIFFSITGVLVSLLLIGIVIGLGTYYSYAKSFKSAKKKSNSTQIIFYDNQKNIIYEGYGTKSPQEVTLSDVPDMLKKATLASEDANFYEHGAIDLRGIVRATIINVRNSQRPGYQKIYDLFSEKNYSQGGSTITQQLVKNIYLTNERSFERKIKEIVFSAELEKIKTKDQILQDYLNNVYYGEQALGISNAAKIYFGKEVSNLNLSEVSMLAGLPAAPTKLSPISGDYNLAKERQEYVLSKMIALGYISVEEAKEAANTELFFKSSNQDLVLRHPFFVDFVKKELAEKIGEEAMDRGGFEIYTTLDPKNQEIAEVKATEYMKKFSSRKVTNAAVVILDNKQGTLSAMVGGVDYDKSKVNVATSLRQPGSSFKPIVYLAGILNGFTASSILPDKFVNFGGNPPYIPKNYDGSYHGNVTVRTALQNSLNIPAVEMTKLVGVEKVAETAKTLGISSLLDNPTSYGLTIGLGSAEVKLYELARAYSVLANNGRGSGFSGISKIVDSEGTEIYTTPKSFSQIIDEKAAYIMANILSDNKARSMVFGSNSPLYLKDRPVAAKTGTTDNYADSWTMGFTPQYTVGVWMGNNDRTVMARVSGIEGAAYIWHDIIEAIHQGLPVEQFTKPAGLKELYIDSKTGLPAQKQSKPYQLEYYLPGTEPTKDTKFDYIKDINK